MIYHKLFLIHQICCKAYKYCDNTHEYCTCRWTQFQVLALYSWVLPQYLQGLTHYLEVLSPHTVWYFFSDEMQLKNGKMSAVYLVKSTKLLSKISYFAGFLIASRNEVCARWIHPKSFESILLAIDTKWIWVNLLFRSLSKVWDSRE